MALDEWMAKRQIELPNLPDLPKELPFAAYDAEVPTPGAEAGAAAVAAAAASFVDYETTFNHFEKSQLERMAPPKK